MSKAEEPNQTLSKTEMNRFVSSSMRSLEEKNEPVTVTRHNKPFAVIIPVKAYLDLLEKAIPQPESAQRPTSSVLGHKTERQPPAYPELTLRLPMEGTKDWGCRQLEVVLNALLGINKAEKVETEEESSVSESGDDDVPGT